MSQNTFRELALKQAPLQAKEIDALTEDAPIFEMMPMMPASNGIQNVYEVLKDIEGAQVVNLDDELPLIDANGDLAYEDLAVLGGIIQVGEDKAKLLGGAPAYFTKKIIPVLRETAANVEKSFIYNNVLPYAKANGREILLDGDTADKQTSIFCIKWVEGETTGLYDATGFGNGKVFDFLPMNGGTVHTITQDGKQIPGYALRIKNYIGFQLANERNVSSIRNVDLKVDTGEESGFNALPTESQMDELILNARAMPNNSFLYMHPKTASALNVYKGGALDMTPSDQDFNRTFANWNGIRIITSYNFSLTEAIQS